MKSIAKNSTILLVDENIEQAQSNALIFKTVGGYKTQICVNPVKVFDFLSNPPQDLVFWTLPCYSVDFFESVKKIREIYGECERPIVMIHAPIIKIDFGVDLAGLVNAYIPEHLIEPHILELIREDLSLLYKRYQIQG